tara:strand:- start:49 stop:528 length:480 start_codon:yes stop_codon:yes gene_type:complete
MWQDKLKEIIYILENSNVNEIEIKSWGHQYRVVKNPGAIVEGTHKLEQPVILDNQNFSDEEKLNNDTSLQGKQKSNGDSIKEKVLSPMPGTFYSAPTPDDDDFVKVGDKVKKGQTLCIIEAMKIMNEIESEHDGVIMEIKTNNGNPVEYNQVLFVISKS